MLVTGGVEWFASHLHFTSHTASVQTLQIFTIGLSAISGTKLFEMLTGAQSIGVTDTFVLL